jgi:hypothetical protein
MKRVVRVLRIDPEVTVIAAKYVDEQLNTLRAHGALSVLKPGQYEDLVYRCAEPVQVIRNWNARQLTKKSKA